MEGNQQKMRNALVLCSRIIGAIRLGEYGIRSNVFMDDIQEAHEAITAALAEPLRNCDVGTAEEQAKRMDAYCASYGERIGGSWRCDKCPFCLIDRCDLVWAQMPYEEEEGGAK